MFGSSSSHSTAQNRALQQASRDKYFQKLHVGASVFNKNVKNILPKERKENAIYSRNQKLIKTMVTAVLLLSIFMYYAFKWIDANLISF